jgi:tRNA pseudouridine13 synthase
MSQPLALDPPTLTGAPPWTGLLRARPEDFRVDEVPAYLPEGSGDHLFVRFEKTDLDTQQAVRRIAQILGVDARQAGVAGLKDRRAVTTQWVSFEHADVARLEGAELEGIRILETSRHRNKLRTGHLKANRFEILVRGAGPEGRAEAERRLAELSRRGLPNYFGEQRFGREGSNLEQARQWIVEGGRAPRDRFQRKLLVSVLQAAMFNELLAARVTEGSYDGVLPGDLLRKEDTGGLFVSTDAELDGARAARFEVSATGPMVGAKMRWPEGEALRREEEALARWSLDRDALERFRSSGEGTRRPYRIAVEQPTIAEEPEGIRLAFTLPSGAYATVLLRELVRVS